MIAGRPGQNTRREGTQKAYIACVKYVRNNMPTCQNCGSAVTEAYVRVFAPDGMDNPRVCPFCEDKVRDGADVRDARSVRH